MSPAITLWCCLAPSGTGPIAVFPVFAYCAYLLPLPNVLHWCAPPLLSLVFVIGVVVAAALKKGETDTKGAISEMKREGGSRVRERVEDASEVAVRDLGSKGRGGDDKQGAPTRVLPCLPPPPPPHTPPRAPSLSLPPLEAVRGLPTTPYSSSRTMRMT